MNELRLVLGSLLFMAAACELVDEDGEGGIANPQPFTPNSESQIGG